MNEHDVYLMILRQRREQLRMLEFLQSLSPSPRDSHTYWLMKVLESHVTGKPCEVDVASVEMEASYLYRMPRCEFVKRFLAPAFETAGAMMWWNKGEAHEIAETVVDQILTRFAVGELGEEQTRLFENDDSEDSYVRRYLKTATKNAIIDFLRKEDAEMRLLRGVGLQKEDLDSVNDPANIAERRDMNERIRDAMDNLPEPLRHVMCLYYNHGRSCNEIASEVSKPVGTIKYHLNLGRRSMAAELIHLTSCEEAANE